MRCADHCRASSQHHMDGMLPNITERSAMNRPRLPPIEETCSRAEVDAIVAAALSKATADMEGMILRLAEATDNEIRRVKRYIKYCSTEIGDLRATISPRPPASAVLPAADSITRIVAQFFDNRHRNAALK